MVTMSWAQDRTVSGKVTSAEDGSSLPGVNVVVKGTTTGGVTDIDGNYKISVPEQGGVLVFSFIGLQTLEVEIGTRSTIDVQMVSDVKQLSEVVVVGYGEIEARKLTSSVTSVDGDQIASMPVPSFDNALQGKAAGVQVTTTSGLLGQAPKIRIRGVNSISSGTYPLIVVDGVPIETGDFSAGVAPNNGLADINPADIASFEVLKDGAATAIYGSRAANGVILITTKRGDAGKAKIDFTAYGGVNKVAKRFDVLNAQEFIEISNEKFATAGIAPQAYPGDNNENTDWQDVIFQTGVVQNYNLGISGGSESTKYYVSANYMSQEGAVVNNSIKRYSVRSNLDYTGVEWLDAGIKLQISNQANSGLNTGTNSLSGNVSNALQAFPNIAIYNPNHPTGYNITPDNNAMGQGNNLQGIAFNLPNIQYVLDHNQQVSTTQRVLANGYLQLNLPFDIKLKTQYGLDVANTSDFLSWDPVHGDGNPTGYVYRGNYLTNRWNWQNTLSYNTTINDTHTIGIVIGNEYQKTRYDQAWGDAQGFSDVFFIKEGLISGSFDTPGSGGYVGEGGFQSYFGRLNYDFRNRYLVSLSVRNDALSSLPEANRKGTFLGASAGWNIAEESFFNVSWLDELKIRGSYAETGNTDLSANLFPYLGTYGPELYGDLTALSFDNVGNSSLKWETTTKLNAGLDFSLISGKISGSIDWYKNGVKDLVLFAPTPPSLGLPGNGINKNIGSLTNSGIELNLDAEILSVGEFKWNANFNLTSNKNEITALANNDGDVPYTYNILRVGESIGSIYGFVYEGVNSANGNPIYKKADGTLIQGDPDVNTYYVYDPSNPLELSTTAVLEEGDKVVLGNPNPKVFGGFNNTFTFKGFELNVFLNYSFGAKILNVTRQQNLSMNFNNNLAEIKDRWTPANTDTDVPRLSYANSNFLNLNGSASSRFLENGDFVRIQNVMLAYNLPQSTISKIGLSKVRVFVQVQNAFVFTNYKGLDPELSFSNTSNIQAGVDYNTNPLMRTITGGINIGF